MRKPKASGTDVAPRNRPAIAVLRRLAAALDSNAHLTAGHDLGSVSFETHAA
jgi:hypothetical protein